MFFYFRISNLRRDKACLVSTHFSVFLRSDKVCLVSTHFPIFLHLDKACLVSTHFSRISPFRQGMPCLYTFSRISPFRQGMHCLYTFFTYFSVQTDPPLFQPIFLSYLLILIFITIFFALWRCGSVIKYSRFIQNLFSSPQELKSLNTGKQKSFQQYHFTN